MGLNISNGFILKTANSAKVEKVNEQLRDIFTALLKKHVCKEIAKTTSKIATLYSNPKIEKNNDNDNLFDILSKEIFYIKTDPVKTLYTHYIKNEDTLFDAVKKTYQLFTRYDLEGRNYNYSDNFIYFKSQKKHTVYLLPFEPEIVDEFRKINEELQLLEDFSYESYCTDGLTRTEYRFRDKVWNSVLKRSSISRDVMNGISINVDYFDIDSEDVIPFIYTEAKRLEMVYKGLRRNELYILGILKTGKLASELSLSDLTELTFEAEEQVQEELKTGDNLLSSKYFDCVANDDEFLDLIFNKKYPPFKV